jgi:hypothetical protein
VNEELPKAWIPAETFVLEEQQRYVNLFAELIEKGSAFNSKFWRLGERGMYEQSVDARVSFSHSGNSATYLELTVHRRYHSKVQVTRLRELGFKRLQPTSTRWSREFIGNPQSDVVANFLFAGIKYLVDFQPNLGFKLAVEDASSKAGFEDILTRYGVWTMPSSADLMFLNA